MKKWWKFFEGQRRYSYSNYEPQKKSYLPAIAITVAWILLILFVIYFNNYLG